MAWTYLPVAFALGGLHALEPGHGKSLASAYLIGGGHGRLDAVVLGLSTTFSHTAVVFLLAAASLGLSHVLPRAVVERGVARVGAWILVALGAWVAVRSALDLARGRSSGHDHGQGRGGHGHGVHGHDHGHGHGDHDHDHDGHGRGGEAAAAAAPGLRPRRGATGALWGVALIGLGNGLLPCPGALAALLVAFSLGQVALGLATVLTYSLGLAAALTAFCVFAVSAGAAVKARLPSDAALLWLPLASGLLVFGTGAWLLVR